MTLKELARFLKVKPPTITKVAKGLENQGYLKMIKDNSDKRITRVNLTNMGKSILEKIGKVWMEIEETTFKSFSVEEKVIFKRLMWQIIENLDHSNKVKNQKNAIDRSNASYEYNTHFTEFASLIDRYSVSKITKVLKRVTVLHRVLALL